MPQPDPADLKVSFKGVDGVSRTHQYILANKLLIS